ncbi:MAG: hypothetical protein J2P19_14270 [Pseudonocardia sp.]|nr:hypothetical protein [Pseudonocardia sp.]
MTTTKADQIARTIEEMILVHLPDLAEPDAGLHTLSTPVSTPTAWPAGVDAVSAQVRPLTRSTSGTSV